MTTDQLTILVPTKNRPHFLERMLNYYAEVGCPFPIRIGDASDPAEYEEDRELVYRYRTRLNLFHDSHQPDFSAHASTVSNLEKSDTPYSVYCGDDDFLVPRQLARGVEFLEQHPDYSSFSGFSLWLYVRQDAGRLTIWQTKPVSLRNFTADTPEKRVVDWSYPAAMNSFAIQRTHQMRWNWELSAPLCEDGDLHGAPLREICYNALSVMAGKSFCTPDLYHVMLRHDDKRFASGSSMDVFERVLGWKKENVDRTLSVLANVLQKHEGFDLDKYTRDVAWAVLSGWILTVLGRVHKRRLAACGFTELTTVSKKSLRQFVADLPGARPLYRLIMGNGVSVNELVNPSNVYHKDFMPVYKVLMAIR